MSSYYRDPNQYLQNLTQSQQMAMINVFGKSYVNQNGGTVEDFYRNVLGMSTQQSKLVTALVDEYTQSGVTLELGSLMSPYLQTSVAIRQNIVDERNKKGYNWSTSRLKEYADKLVIDPANIISNKLDDIQNYRSALPSMDLTNYKMSDTNYDLSDEGLRNLDAANIKTEYDISQKIRDLTKRMGGNTDASVYGDIPGQYYNPFMAKSMAPKMDAKNKAAVDAINRGTYYEDFGDAPRLVVDGKATEIFEMYATKAEKGLFTAKDLNAMASYVKLANSESPIWEELKNFNPDSGFLGLGQVDIKRLVKESGSRSSPTFTSTLESDVKQLQETRNRLETEYNGTVSRQLSAFKYTSIYEELTAAADDGASAEDIAGIIDSYNVGLRGLSKSQQDARTYFAHGSYSNDTANLKAADAQVANAYRFLNKKNIQTADLLKLSSGAMGDVIGMLGEYGGFGVTSDDASKAMTKLNDWITEKIKTNPAELASKGFGEQVSIMLDTLSDGDMTKKGEALEFIKSELIRRSESINVALDSQEPTSWEGIEQIQTARGRLGTLVEALDGANAQEVAHITVEMQQMFQTYTDKAVAFTEDAATTGEKIVETGDNFVKATESLVESVQTSTNLMNQYVLQESLGSVGADVWKTVYNKIFK